MFQVMPAKEYLLGERGMPRGEYMSWDIWKVFATICKGYTQSWPLLNQAVNPLGMKKLCKWGFIEQTTWGWSGDGAHGWVLRQVAAGDEPQKTVRLWTPTKEGWHVYECQKDEREHGGKNA